MSVGKAHKQAVDFYNMVKSVTDEKTVMVHDKSGSVEVTIKRIKKGEQNA